MAEKDKPQIKVRRVLAAPVRIWELVIAPLSGLGRTVAGLITLITVLIPALVKSVGWHGSITLLLLFLLILSWWALDASEALRTQGRPRISRIAVNPEHVLDQYTNIYLVIENEGASGDFTAEIDVNLYDWPTGQRFACWDNHDAPTRRIPEGSRGMIYLASLETFANRGQWSFIEWARSGPPNQYTVEEAFSLKEQSGHPEYTAQLTLYSEPPMVDGPRIIKVHFQGSRAELVE